MRLAKRISVVLAALLQTGCALKFMYNQLDWLIPWYVDDYISFDPAQEVLFDARLEQYLRWHRQEQLPQYADFFESVADAMADRLSAAEMESFERQARAFSKQLL